MTYTPIIFTEWDVHYDSGGITGTVRTRQNCTLWLLLDSQLPSRSPRFVTKYGHTRECGFTYHWPTAAFIHEDGPGGGTTHTWDIPQSALIRHQYAAAISGPAFGPGTSATPPVAIT